jgi:hypothetical protein
MKTHNDFYLNVNIWLFTHTDRFDVSYPRRRVSSIELNVLDSRFRGNDILLYLLLR